MQKQWNPTTRYLVLVLLILAGAWLLYAARPLIGPLVISALLAYVLNPMVHLLTRRTRLRHRTAAMLVYALFLSLIVAIPSSLMPALVRQVTRFSLDLQSIESQIEQLFASPIIIGNIMLSPSQFITDVDQLVREFMRELPGGALNVLGEVTANVIWILAILVTTFYLLQDGYRLRAWIVQMAPPDYRRDVQRLTGEIDRVWSSFLRGQLALMIAVGVLTGVLTAAVGLRGALVLAIVAGVLDVVPSLGPMVAGFVAVLVAFFSGSTYIPISNFWFGVLVAGLFVLIEQVKNIWLRPQIMGHTLHLHPGLVFVGVLGALALMGVLGALIIVPVMASVGILGRYARARILGEPPWPEESPHQSGEAEKNEGAEN